MRIFSVSLLPSGMDCAVFFFGVAPFRCDVRDAPP